MLPVVWERPVCRWYSNSPESLLRLYIFTSTYLYRTCKKDVEIKYTSFIILTLIHVINLVKFFFKLMQKILTIFWGVLTLNCCTTMSCCEYIKKHYNVTQYSLIYIAFYDAWFIRYFVILHDNSVVVFRINGISDCIDV